jgi:hypothetical protein
MLGGAAVTNTARVEIVKDTGKLLTISIPGGLLPVHLIVDPPGATRGTIPMTSPTGWVYLRSTNCAIRWQRGDKVAYIFEGKQTETNSDEGVAHRDDLATRCAVLQPRRDG